VGRISSGAPTSAASVHIGSIHSATAISEISETMSRPSPMITACQTPCTAAVSPCTRSISDPGGWVW
jgi:hypothetical protein